MKGSCPQSWQVLTLLLRCVVPYPTVNPTEISGTELHAVMCTMRLVLHLVLKSRWSGTATCPQSHIAQIVSCKQCLWLILLRAHQPHPLFLYNLALGLLQVHAVHLIGLSSVFRRRFLLDSSSLTQGQSYSAAQQSDVCIAEVCEDVEKCFECIKSHRIMLGDCVA